MGCIPSKTADSNDVEGHTRTRKTRSGTEKPTGQVRAQQHPEHTINIPAVGDSGKKGTPHSPTEYVRGAAPAPPDSAFSTPGRVLGSAPSELSRDAYTGQRIYSPNDPNHPSRRPISSAFKKKYKRYYDEASPQMPQHLFWD